MRAMAFFLGSYVYLAQFCEAAFPTRGAVFSMTSSPQGAKGAVVVSRLTFGETLPVREFHDMVTYRVRISVEGGKVMKGGIAVLLLIALVGGIGI